MKLISFITTDGKLIHFNPTFLVSVNYDSDTKKTTVHVLDEPFYTVDGTPDSIIEAIKETEPLF